MKRPKRKYLLAFFKHVLKRTGMLALQAYQHEISSESHQSNI